MSIYFAFSDESGNYQKERGENFLRAHPYYVRATYLILANDWKILSDEMNKLKEVSKLPLDKEIKWSYLWAVKKYQLKKEEIPPDKPFSFLNGADFKNLLSFYDSSLELISKLSYGKIILTITLNESCGNIGEIPLYKMHLQDTMQRLEMELQSENTNLCVLYFDPISEGKNVILREAYHELYQEDDFIKNFSHIKDSLNFEISHHSVGVQIADYIAGCTCSCLKGFDNSRKLYKSRILPFVRKGNNHDVIGYGVTEIPKSDDTRKILSKSVCN